ncbi:recombinase family protein [Parafrigoribacterium mesophilum]|uniref:recombinase family protein n=1 Tax=Parafrigoribacterium mesophilum TaxID=433646 RepID=UPI0031FE38E8
MTRIGYIWVGPFEHNADFQRDILLKRGVDLILEDISVGSKASRHALTAALDRLVSGDTLVVWRLDRLGNTLPNILALMELLGNRNIAVVAVVEDIDTLSGSAVSLLGVVSSFIELERSLARERTVVGVYSARARGHVGGRPRALSAMNVERVLIMKEQGVPVRDIARELGTSRATIYRALAPQTDEQPPAAAELHSSNQPQPRPTRGSALSNLDLATS